MGIIKGPNAHALVLHERNNTCNPKTNQKVNGKAHSKHKKEDNPKPFNDSSDSKGRKGKKGKYKCNYFNCDY
jgi:hypothetical protein